MIPAKIEPLDSLAALIQSQRFEEAISLLEQRLKTYPLEDRGWALLGQAFYNLRRQGVREAAPNAAHAALARLLAREGFHVALADAFRFRAMG